MVDDALASSTTLERPSDNGQVERASEVQPQSGTDGRPSTGQVAQEQDNIRKLQSTYDKKLAEKDRQYQAQMQQQNQIIQQMQRELREQRKSMAPDDYTRLQIDLDEVIKERDAYAAAYQQTMKEREAEQVKINALDRIAERYGVTRDDLLGAEDYETAIELAIDLRDRRKQKQQAQDDDKRERNMPDIGGGAPRTTQSEWERDYAEARRTKNTPAMMRLLRERPKGAG
jgi:hypothetical protein